MKNYQFFLILSVLCFIVSELNSGAISNSSGMFGVGFLIVALNYFDDDK